MKKQAKIALALVFVTGIGAVLWRVFFEREPRYQGKSLTYWLEEYNRAGAMDKTLLVNEAIRTMGDRTLPFLLAYLNQKDFPNKQNLFLLAEKQHLVHFPPPRREPYLSPALLALKALGPRASPIIPELLSMFENPVTVRQGGLALFSIGPDSIPAFQQACENTNSIVRAEAATFLALLPLGYNDDQPYYCIWYKFRDDSKPQAYVARPPDSYLLMHLASLARNHPKPGVRSASVEAMATYYRTPHGDHPEVVVQTLRKALRDPGARVRESATEALNSIGLGSVDANKPN